MRRGTSGILLTLALMVPALPALAVEITVSAAASLSNAFREIGAAYEKQYTGDKVLFNFAASDALVQQIAKGAPVDVLASADQEAMDKADGLKLLAAGTRRNFASNTLVLVQAVDRAPALREVRDLAGAAVQRVALGNPASVPAGRYGRAALEQAGVWPAVVNKLIYASSVRQCLDYVVRGEVDAGLVYGTDAALMKDKLHVLASLPTATPISYPIAVIGAAAQAPAARRFADFVQAPAGQAILARYGFGRP